MILLGVLYVKLHIVHVVWRAAWESQFQKDKANSDFWYLPRID